MMSILWNGMRTDGARWAGGRPALLLALAALMQAGVVGQAGAAVSGSCANCHTMHNSQNGLPMRIDGQAVPLANLLVSGCVGCHSHEGTETIVTVNGSRTPIVWNTGAVPNKPLAGGNFYWVEANGDTYGHNVLGISGQDSLLSRAPGALPPGASTGCANSCHDSLARTTVNIPGGGGSLTLSDGCQSCHGSVRHHGATLAPGQPATAASGWYRFLKAPAFHGFADQKPGVSGIGDPDWEQNPTSSSHNIYLAGNGASNNPDPRPLSRFCAGCHSQFHAPGNVTNGGGSNPWLRHPTNYAIPNSGEFAAVIGADYDPLVPVAKPSLSSYDPARVEAGDQVACVSCHRAHGSPYSDMLRWDYTEMRAHEGGAAAGSGCFFCHTRKDS